MQGSPDSVGEDGCLLGCQMRGRASWEMALTLPAARRCDAGRCDGRVFLGGGGAADGGSEAPDSDVPAEQPCRRPFWGGQGGQPAGSPSRPQVRGGALIACSSAPRQRASDSFQPAPPAWLRR